MLLFKGKCTSDNICKRCTNYPSDRPITCLWVDWLWPDLSITAAKPAPQITPRVHFQDSQPKLAQLWKTRSLRKSESCIHSPLCALLVACRKSNTNTATFVQKCTHTHSHPLTHTRAHAHTHDQLPTELGLTSFPLYISSPFAWTCEYFLDRENFWHHLYQHPPSLSPIPPLSTSIDNLLYTSGPISVTFTFPKSKLSLSTLPKH